MLDIINELLELNQTVLPFFDSFSLYDVRSSVISSSFSVAFNLSLTLNSVMSAKQRIISVFKRFKSYFYVCVARGL